MSMGYGYFRIEFYTNDGSPDADAAKRAYDWCMENYDWFKGENGDGSDIPPFLLSGNSFEANDDDYYADGLVIKGTNIPGDVDWLADAAKETKAARLVASVIQDYSESSHWSNWYTEKVWIDGEERDSYEVGEFTRTMADYSPYDRDSSIAFRLEEGGFRRSRGKFKNAKTGEIVLGGLLRFRLDDEDYIDTESSLLAFWNSDGRVPIDKDSIDKKECVRAFVSEVKSLMSNDCEIDESDWTFEGFDSQPSFFDIYGKNPPTAPFMDCEDYAKKLDLKNGIFHCTDKSATNVTIPEGVTAISGYAFDGCESLSSVAIPSSVTEIGEWAFNCCHSLSSVEFGGTKAQWDAVKGKLELIKCIPAPVVKCADGEWQKPVVLLEDGVVMECFDRGMTSVVIPEGVTAIGKYAFWGCKSLSSVVIPSSVTEIGANAFEGCSSLSSVEFGGTVAQWESVKGKQNLLAYIPASSVKCADGEWQKPVLLVENGVAVKYLDKNATSVVIPEGVTEIGANAFKGCESLASVEIPSSVTEIGEDAFKGCTSLLSVEIPSSVTEIGGYAFYGCESLSSVEIPSSVTEIGGYAFYGCESLSSVEIPSSVTEIGGYAFKGCESLSSVEFGGTAAQWESVKKGDYWNHGVPATSVKCADGEAALEE